MSLSIAGDRDTGQSVRDQNVTAALAIANIVKSSLGPVGLDKMLVDQIGDVTVTNDGATILKQLEVEHPAAKVLVELSNLQDEEVGDGTTSVVVIASELLKRANELVKQNIHATSIISGFLRAKKEACQFIAKNLALKVDQLGDDAVLKAAKTTMSSKLIGTEPEFFARMAVDSMLRVKTINSSGVAKYPVKAVNILKVTGGSQTDSKLIDGYALQQVRASLTMPKRVENAKIAMIDMDLRKHCLKFGVQMLITDPEEIEKMRAKEIAITKRKIDMLLDAGANVVITTRGIDEMSCKYLAERGAIGIRRVEKKMLRRIAKLTGGKLLMSFGDEDGEDSVDPSRLGEAKVVEEERVGDYNVMFIKGCVSTAAQTILLRGANMYMLEEIERSIHDSLCIVKRVLESKRVVPGGGAVEAALSVYLDSVAEAMGSREQLAIAEFASALLVIPKTLAINGAHDATDLVAKLRGYHNAAQQDKERAHWKHIGLDLTNGKVRDNVKAGVLEPAMSKIKQIKFATEAAVTILRIDDSIKMFQPQQQQG